eukprot:TRINITY_DN5846_c1_g1_i1.p1 TRINITY_DN5846_c1_g1~~TRINITY_DN5846_c1_g1_i1.p1  ORF type:complete len:115 (-),score=25.44 TRINITY_DN5846_c1_g1_i1:271-615(-)
MNACGSNKKMDHRTTSTLERSGTITKLDGLGKAKPKPPADPSFKEKLAYILVKTKVGRFLDAFQLLLSIFSIVIYVYSTYDPKGTAGWLTTLDVVLAFIFMVDYLMHTYIASNR